MKKKYLDKNKILLLLSPTIYNFGDVLFDFFIAWKLVDETGDLFNAVYVIGGSILFRALITIFIGMFVDKYNKKHLLLLSAALSALIIAVFGVSYSFSIGHVGVALLFVFINDINNEIYGRSLLTMSAELLKDDTFIKYQSQSSIIRRVISIFGSSIAAFLIALFSSKIIIVIKILSFLLAGLCILPIDYKFERKESSKKISILKDLKFTAQYIIGRKTIVAFIAIMFILNFVYGFIPHMYPIILSTKLDSVLLMGFIKTAMAIGEIIGLAVINFFAREVSKLFKVAMIGSIVSIVLTVFSGKALILCGFFLYGLFDSLTQPLFSHVISSIDDWARGRVIGGIDAIILLSPSIGIWLGTALLGLNSNLGYIFIVSIFIIALVLFTRSKELSNIKLERD